MILAFFSSAQMILLECHKSPATWLVQCTPRAWTIFKNHLLEVNRSWKPMTLQTLTTIDLFYFIMSEDSHEYKFIEIAIDWGASHIWLHTNLRVRDHTTWFWRCVGMAFGHFLLDSHNFMVTALGSCVKCPLVLVILHSQFTIMRKTLRICDTK